MNRTAIISVVLLVVGDAVFQKAMPSAWGSTIIIDSVSTTTKNDTYDLTALGTLDWVFPTISEMGGGTAIITTDGAKGVLPSAPNEYWDGSAPVLNFTNGTPGSWWGLTGSSLTGSHGVYTYEDASSYATINLPAGKGVVNLIVGAWSYDLLGVPGTVTATFADSSSASTTILGDATQEHMVISYSTMTAQAMTITVADTGRSGNAGFYAVAVSSQPIPEPSAIVMVLLGVVGLAAYAWRRPR